MRYHKRYWLSVFLEYQLDPNQAVINLQSRIFQIPEHHYCISSEIDKSLRIFIRDGLQRVLLYNVVRGILQIGMVDEHYGNS